MSRAFTIFLIAVIALALSLDDDRTWNRRVEFRAD